MKTLTLLITASLIVVSSTVSGQIKLTSDSDVRSVYDVTFGPGSGKKLGSLTAEDKKVAEKLLTEMVKNSCKLTLTGKKVASALRPNARKIMIAIAKRSYGKDCSGIDEDGRIYDMIRKKVAQNWKSAFQNRCDSDDQEWIY